MAELEEILEGESAEEADVNVDVLRLERDTLLSEQDGLREAMRALQLRVEEAEKGMPNDEELIVALGERDQLRVERDNLAVQLYNEREEGLDVTAAEELTALRAERDRLILELSMLQETRALEASSSLEEVIVCRTCMARHV